MPNLAQISESILSLNQFKIDLKDSKTEIYCDSVLP